MPRNNAEPTRVRVHGTEVTSPRTAAERAAAIRRIVERGQYAKVDGTMVDLFSASAIVRVMDALTPANLALYTAMPVEKMARVAFRLLK